MALEKNIVKLEKEIRGKMLSIRLKKLSPKDSGIGKLINLMKSFDEVLYLSLIKEYKTILQNLDKSIESEDFQDKK